MPSHTATTETRTLAALTHAHFGERLSMTEVFARVGLVTHPPPSSGETAAALWVGSVGYERHKDHRAFARHLGAAGVERLVDVRELPLSRRHGYSKSALSRAMAEVDIEYVHIKALGNPKPYRDLYKSGQVEEGRRWYRQYLLKERRKALRDVVPLLHDKRAALMCVEHDPTVCHRAVIIEALRDELGLDLEIAEIG
jgi:hypothetical protein